MFSSQILFLALFDDCLGPIRRRHHPRGTKRGRPRGSTRRGAGNGSISNRTSTSPGQVSLSSNNEGKFLNKKILTSVFVIKKSGLKKD